MEHSHKFCASVFDGVRLSALAAQSVVRNPVSIVYYNILYFFLARICRIYMLDQLPLFIPPPCNMSAQVYRISRDQKIVRGVQKGRACQEQRCVLFLSYYS